MHKCTMKRHTFSQFKTEARAIPVDWILFTLFYTKLGTRVNTWNVSYVIFLQRDIRALQTYLMPNFGILIPNQQDTTVSLDI